MIIVDYISQVADVLAAGSLAEEPICMGTGYEKRKKKA
jgi:hypothetical protein